MSEEEIDALTNAEKERHVLRALLANAAHMQGGHSRRGKQVADLLRIPFPITMPNLKKFALAHDFDPQEVWPWLKETPDA